MEMSHREILNRLRQNIIEDIDVHNGIINFLLSQNIISNNDVDEINVAESKSDKAAALLDKLPNRGPRAFKYFQESLKQQYPWLKDQMAELERSIDKYITSNSESIRSSVPSIEPPLPTLTVPRREETEQLKSALSKLRPNDYVVLYGMKGYGKSWLATSILNDKQFVKKVFNDEIYWLRFGCESKIEDKIMIQMNHLHHTITNVASSLNSGQLNDISRTLKQYFLEINHKNALVILDDVWDKQIIEKFDFGCKTLVITTNISLLGDKRHCEYIKMENGFTLDESLQLFAEALNTEIDRLPNEAKEIHVECRGMPLLIAMFAAQFEEFKDDMKISVDRWQYYLKALRAKDKTNCVMGKILTRQQVTFDMCIGQLSPDHQKLYKMLVIFDVDINIFPTTLAILWGRPKFEVEDIMVSLCHKSLAVKHWNADLKSYTYGIHELLVTHLRDKISPVGLINHHKKFVEKMFQNCNNDYSKLPQDNYSYSYIGHHLEKAKMFHIFPKMYLNLSFLQAKIYGSGISDLLIDLVKYREYITNNDLNYEEKVCNIENFIRSNVRILADHRHRQCLDLVQIALNQPQSGFCRDTAREFAYSNPNYFYFSHKKQHQSPDSPVSTERTIDELTTVNFIDDANQILIGNKYGQVLHCHNTSWYPYDHRENSVIKKVIVSVHNDFFLALNNKSTIKRYRIRENIFDDWDHKSRTPREKQAFWNAFYSDKEDKNDVTYILEDQQITDMTLSSDSQRIAACTTKGIIAVWYINGSILSKMSSSENGLQRIIFAKGNKYIHALDIKGLSTIYAANGDGYDHPGKPLNLLWRRARDADSYLNDIKIVYFQNIETSNPLEVRSVIVTEERAYLTTICISESGTLCNPDTRNLFETNNCKFVTATLTHDDLYLITADTEYFIKVWNVNTPFDPVQSYAARAISLDTYMCGDCHLILSGYRQTTQIFTFRETDSSPRSIKRPQFHAVMKPGDPDMVLQEIGNKIGLSRGYELIAEFPYTSQQIVALSLSEDIKKILYATNRGEVYLYNVDEETSTLIMSLSECSNFVKFLGIENTIVCKDKDQLIFWCDNHVSRTSATNVVDVHTIRNNYVITVSRDGTILSWEKIQSAWQPINYSDASGENIRRIAMRNSNISYSSLNTEQNMLALLNVTFEMILYIIKYDINGVPMQIKQFGNKNYFSKELKCCAFSLDGKLIAIGMYDGDIAIYDIYEGRNYGQLHLHCNSIRQLHWVPNIIGVPILFSVNCDELAVWNIALMVHGERRKRRGRTGMTRSYTIPFNDVSSTSSSCITSSQSANADLCCLTPKHLDIQSANNVTSFFEGSHQFWSSKIAKNPNFPALLGLISLPLSCNAKLSVSPDCNKFLSVDVHGSINNITLFDPFTRINDD